MVSIVELPVEILLEIFHHIPAVATAPFKGHLAHVCRVNKLFNNLATPLLYETVHFEHADLVKNGDLSKAMDAWVSLRNSKPFLIRNLSVTRNTIYRRIPTENHPVDPELVRAKVRIRIEQILKRIKRDQLLSLSITTGELRDLQALAESQTRLQKLRLNYRLLDSWNFEIFKLLGASSVSTSIYLASPRNWGWALAKYASLKTRMTALSFINTTLSTGLILLLGLVSANASTLRSLEVRFRVDPLSHRFSEPEYLEAQLGYLTGEGVDFSILKINCLDLEEVSLSEFHWWDILSRVNLSTIVNLERLRKLTLVECSPLKHTLYSVLPLTTNLSELRLIFRGEDIDFDAIALLPNGLRTLQIVQSQSGPGLRKSVLKRHHKTLELLWLEHGGSRYSPLPIYDEELVDWESISNGTFPRLKQFATYMPGNFYHDDMVVKIITGGLRVLRILNVSEFTLGVNRLIIDPEAPQDIDIARHMASTANHLKNSKCFVPTLQALRFGQSTGSIGIEGEQEVHLLLPDNPYLNPTKAEYVKSTVQQAKFWYSGMEILDFERRDMEWT